MNLGPAVAPLTGLFGAGVLLRRLAYDRRWLTIATPPVQTVAVGGLEVGGSGKTPVTGRLLEAFLAAGRYPGLLTRGYGRQTRGLVLRRQGEPAVALCLGDEPAMLVHGGLDVPVAACERRVLGAYALAEIGADVLVLDDAFSHRAMGRHVDVVVLRGEAPFGNGHLMPWGSLREPASSLRRARVVWLHFRGEPVSESPPWFQRLCPQASLVIGRAEPTQAVDRAGRPVALAGERALGVAGIARPDGFFDTLTQLGLALVERRVYRDHHRYSADDAAQLLRLCEATRARFVVTTPKDAVKLAEVFAGPLVMVGTQATVVQGGAALASALELPTHSFESCKKTTQQRQGAPDNYT